MPPENPAPLDDRRLHDAARAGACERIAELTRENPALLTHSRAVRPDLRPLSALHVAKDGDTVHALLLAGAQVDLDHEGWTPLHEATDAGRVSAARALLEAGASCEAQCRVTNDRPLHRALLHARDTLVDLLLAFGADPHTRASAGTTTLHHANTAYAVEQFLSRGLDLNAVDAFGCTPLDVAQLRGVDATSALVARGARTGSPAGRTWPGAAWSKSFLRVEPLGNPDLVPAFAIGYQTDTSALKLNSLAGQLPLPDWLLGVAQQAGGYATSYPNFIGVLLRLEGNLDALGPEAHRLLAGFHAMAEDPNYKLLLREHPRLHDLCGTFGNPYEPKKLRLIEQELATVMPRVPSVRSGIEAFVEFDPCDPLSYFQGWRMLSLTPRTPPPWTGARELQDHESTRGLELNEEQRFEADVLAALQTASTGRQAGDVRTTLSRR